MRIFALKVSTAWKTKVFKQEVLQVNEVLMNNIAALPKDLPHSLEGINKVTCRTTVQITSSKTGKNQKKPKTISMRRVARNTRNQY